MRRTAGDCRLRLFRPGKVRDTGVFAEPGVGGTDAGLIPEGVDGIKVLRPPHLAHFGFSPEALASVDKLPRRPVRFGW